MKERPTSEIADMLEEAAERGMLLAPQERCTKPALILAAIAFVAGFCVSSLIGDWADGALVDGYVKQIRQLQVANCTMERAIRDKQEILAPAGNEIRFVAVDPDARRQLCDKLIGPAGRSWSK